MNKRGNLPSILIQTLKYIDLCLSCNTAAVEMSKERYWPACILEIAASVKRYQWKTGVYASKNCMSAPGSISVLFSVPLIFLVCYFFIKDLMKQSIWNLNSNTGNIQAFHCCLCLGRLRILTLPGWVGGLH